MRFSDWSNWLAGRLFLRFAGGNSQVLVEFRWIFLSNLNGIGGIAGSCVLIWELGQ